VGYALSTMAESSRGTQLTLSNVARSFNGRAALSPISFQIQAGEFVSLLGPSGSGKSTLLRVMAGLETIDQGTLAVAGSSRAFVFQDAALLPWQSVLQNVALPLELTGASGDPVAALRMVGLDDVGALYPNELSGGMKMRVSVARALVSKPSLLFLDEPFGALDERTRHRLQEDLRRLWINLGMTVVFVTHSASEAVFVSDRAIVLSDGPGRVVDDHAISLGRDRSPELRNDAAYIREVAYLRGVMP
jgi:NitT/TauT family transport system ATP-binding protein